MRGRLQCGVGLCLLVLLGCGGGSGGSSGGGDVNPIQGTIETTDFTIPAGETRTAVATLNVRATGRIAIDGKLIIKPGVDVTLGADGPLNVSGSVEEMEGTAPKTRADEPPAITLRGDNVTVASGATVVGNVSGVNIIVAKEGGTITVNGTVETRDGRNGKDAAAGKEAESGERAAGLNISAGAVGRYKAANPGKSAFVAKTLSVTGTIRTGSGGHGGHDLVGVHGQAGFTAEAGNGGAGGDFLWTRGSTDLKSVGNGKVVMGDGGVGGNCGSASAPLKGRDGQGPGAPGEDVRLRSGSGGNPGVILGPVPQGLNVVAGKGGEAGSVYGVAGSGGPYGPGGKGSFVVGAEPVNVGRGVPPEVVAESGGNGGHSNDPMKPGGVGGRVEVFRVGGAAIPRIVLDNVGRGGNGFSGCSDNPERPGTAGGNGADLFVNGNNYQLSGNSFAGGNGGDGDGPGNGGTGGSDDSPKKIGADGKRGQPCGGSSTIPDGVGITDWNMRVDFVALPGYTWFGDYGTVGRAIGTFNYPCGVAYDSASGRIIVADRDQNSIEWFTSFTGAGAGEFGTAGSGVGQFSKPMDIAVAPSGFYIADSANNRIIRMSNLTGGGWTEYKPTGDNALSRPVGVSVDSAGRIYICDTDHNQIVRINDMTGAGRVAYGSSGNSAGSFFGPSKIAFDALGRIYITDRDNHRIVKIDDMTGTNWASIGTQGAGIRQFTTPQYVAIGSDGDIWVADSNNHRIVRMDDMTGSGWTTYGTFGSGMGQFIAPYGLFTKY